MPASSPIRDRSASQGQVVVKLLVLAVPCLLIVLGIYAVLHSLRLSRDCQANLRTLYRAFELYEMERGTLPRLAFFPDLPAEDTDSLKVVLEPFGASAGTCLCPASPPNLRDNGLSYVWNTRLNGQKMPKGDQPREWMLVEVQALSDDVPAPHWGRYHVLYSDGRVERMADPKNKLTGF